MNERSLCQTSGNLFIRKIWSVLQLVSILDQRQRRNTVLHHSEKLVPLIMCLQTSSNECSKKLTMLLILKSMKNLNTDQDTSSKITLVLTNQDQYTSHEFPYKHDPSTLHITPSRISVPNLNESQSQSSTINDESHASLLMSRSSTICRPQRQQIRNSRWGYTPFRITVLCQPSSSRMSCLKGIIMSWSPRDSNALKIDCHQREVRLGKR